MEATGERDIEVCCDCQSDQSISTYESVVAEASEATPRGAAWREVR